MTATPDDLQSLREMVARYYRGHPARRDRLTSSICDLIQAAAAPIQFAFIPQSGGWMLGPVGSAGGARYFAPMRPLRFLELARFAIEYDGVLLPFADMREIDEGSTQISALCEARSAAVRWVASLPACTPLATALEHVRAVKGFGLQYEAVPGFQFITR